MMVDEDDLSYIVERMGPVRAQYYQIGTLLHLNRGELNAIRRKNVDSAEAMIEIISNWLKLNYKYELHGKPSWKILVRAIANPMGGNDRALAMEIAKGLLVNLATSTLCSVIELCWYA